MDNFNFALSLNESSVNTNTNLKPFEIHHVKFQEAAINEGTAKATGKHYKNLSLKFANNKGHADLTIFWPNPDEDGIRPERTTLMDISILTHLVGIRLKQKLLRLLK